MTFPDDHIHPIKFRDGEINEKGLTIREHFAAMAMQGIIASCDPEENPWIDAESAAIQAVKFADALIKELNK